MNKKSKLFLYPFIFIMLMILALVMLLPYMIRYSIEESFKKYTPYEAKVDMVDIGFVSGDIYIHSVNLFLAGNPVLSIKNIHTGWSWGSVLKNEIEIENFSIGGLSTSVKYDENLDVIIAEKNIKDFSSNPDVEKNSEVPEKGKSNPIPFKVNEVKLSNFEFAINEEDRLKIENFRFTGLDSSKPDIASHIDLLISINETQQISIAGEVFPLDLGKESKLKIDLKNIDLEKARALATKAGIVLDEMKGVITLSEFVAFKVMKEGLDLSSDGEGELSNFSYDLDKNRYELKTLKFKKALVVNKNIKLNFSGNGEAFSLYNNNEHVVSVKDFLISNLLFSKIDENLNFSGDIVSVTNLELPSSAIESENKSVGDSKLLIKNFTGSLNSSEATKLLNIKSEIGEFGTLNLKQSSSLQSSKQSTKVEIKSLDLTDLSSLTINQIGYRVGKGKLDALYQTEIDEKSIVNGNLDLTLLNLELSGENEVGKKIKKDRGAPLATMINLIKDSENKIILNFPIEGDANKTEFGLRKILGKSFGSFILGQLTSAITNIAVQSYLPMLASSVALSPASILALGKAGYDFLSKLRFEPIKFELKKSILDKPAKLQLDKVAMSLQKHPGVILNFCPKADVAELFPSGNKEKIEMDQAKEILELANSRINATTEYLIGQKKVNPSQVISCKPEITEEAPPQPLMEIAI